MGTLHQLGESAVIDRVVVLAALLRLNARPGNPPADPSRVRQVPFAGHRFTSNADVLAVQAANPALVALVGGSLRLTPEGLRQARERPNPRYAVR
jgi:hypothetical protein